MRPIPSTMSAPALSDWHLGCALFGLGGSLLLPHPFWFAVAVGLLPLCGRLWRMPLAFWSIIWFVAFLGLGALNGSAWIDRQVPQACLGNQVRVVGLIETLPRVEPFDGEQWRVTAEMRVEEWGSTDCGSPDRIKVSQYLGAEQLDTAMRYRHIVSGLWRLKNLSSQLNAGSLPDQSRWVSRGLDGAAVAVGSLHQKNSQDLIAAFRARLLAYWGQRDGEGWSVMRALLLGDTRSLSEAAWRDLRQLGVIHVMVISGLHIGLLALWCDGLFSLPRRLMRLPGDRGGSVLLPIALLGVTGGYVLLVGAGLPVLRAYCMLLATQMPTALGWSVSGRRSLLLALVVLAAMDPRILLGASFWLSAAATWLLVDTQTRQAGVMGLVQLQMKMVFLMAPITLFFFSETSVLGVVANVLIVPAVTWVMVPLGLFGVAIFPCFPSFADAMWSACVAFWQLLRVPMDWLLTCCVDFAVVARPVSLAVFGLGVLAILCWMSHRRLAVSLWGVGLLLSSGPFPYSASDRVNITILDVAQGLSVVIQVGRRTLVYDTGQAHPNGMSQAAKVLLPFLAGRGVKELDLLMVSHADQDHSGGYDDVVNHLPVQRRLGFRGEQCRHGERWQWGVAEFLVMNGPGWGDVDRNDRSCALLINWGGHSALLTGDVSRQREREWVRYWQHELRASLLLLPHHGSKTSTSHALLKWVRPQWAVASSGRGNPFGHPHFEVVDRITSSKDIQLFDTASHGAIAMTASTDGPVQIHTQRTAATPYWLKLP